MNIQITFPLIILLSFILSACGAGGESSTSGVVISSTGTSAVDEIITENVDSDGDSDGDGVPDAIDDFPEDNTRASTVDNAFSLLQQATFGPTEEEIDRIVKIGREAWIDEQLEMPSAYDSTSDDHKTHLERTIEIAQLIEPDFDWYPSGPVFNQAGSATIGGYQMASWWENSLGNPGFSQSGKDQLRQRVAYALSQLLVTSNYKNALYRHSESLAYYYDILAKNSFGNYRTLIGEVTRSATMGVFLSHQGNMKSDLTKGRRPDENYARELMQLFTLGPIKLNLDGSHDGDGDFSTYPDSNQTLLPVYSQTDVEELAKVLTGWDLDNIPEFGRTTPEQGNYSSPMKFYADFHEDESDENGDGLISLLGKTLALNSGNDGSGLDAALDTIFQHPNIAPFVSRHLIKNLVTSNPSPEYVARVSLVFNDNGDGVKGDLKAVIRAILTDDYARRKDMRSVAIFGKFKEPLLVWTQLLRTFDVETLNGWQSPFSANTSVNGVYIYRYPQAVFDQAPLRANSVFNFYEPDYVPGDDYYSQNALISPEAKLLSQSHLISVYNKISFFLETHEKNIINGGYSGQSTANLESLPMLINFDRELAIFEFALDGDTNGDFINMDEVDLSDYIPYREKAVDALLVHLNKIMLGNAMTESYRSTLRHYLLNATHIKKDDNIKEALNIIGESVRLISTSSIYAVQK